MDWTAAGVIDEFRTLWYAQPPVSTAEIGRRLGTSKNSIVGKAHRLDLDPRPSPIRRRSVDILQPKDPIPTPRLPPLLSATPLLPLACAVELAVALHAPAPVDRPPPALVGWRIEAKLVQPNTIPVRAILKPISAPKPQPYGRVYECAWPIGNPGTQEFRFCKTESLPGKPYCAEHHKLAHIRVREREEA